MMYIYIIMRFIAHKFPIGCVGLYFVYRPKSRFIFKNIYLFHYTCSNCIAFRTDLRIIGINEQLCKKIAVTVFKHS